MYWKYLKYVIKHKINVGIECFKIGLYWHAFTHDLSKFLPSEFIPYAKYMPAFRGESVPQHIKDDLDMAWLRHQHRNKHHWDYWVNSKRNALPMPNKYAMQMIADWRGMSRKFGGTAKEYYEANRESMILHIETTLFIEHAFRHIYKGK